MTDRELLELAAKAAGVPLEAIGDGKATVWVGGLNRAFTQWNPLTDDGDALRLAVKLNLLYGKVFARGVAESHEDGDDIYAVTRRAIVLAAAQIGKDMQ